MADNKLSVIFYNLLQLILLKFVILYISNLSAIFPIWEGREAKSTIWIYCAISFVFDINSFILKELSIERLWASNLFLLMEFICLSAYFSKFVFPERVRRLMLFFTAFVSVYFVLHTYMLSVRVPNYMDGALLYAIYVFYCLCGFYKVISEIEFILLEKNPLFIVCVAILLYASGSFIIFLFEHKIWSVERSFGNVLWMYIRNPANIIKNLLLAYSLRLVKIRK